MSWLLLLVLAGPTVTVSGHVSSASGKHAVRVALWSADTFLKQPVQTAQFDAGQPTDFRFEVPPGRWALSAYEDINGNGKLDEGLFGPKEPAGFYRKFTAWHRPSFDEVAFDVQAPLEKLDIQLK